MADTQEQNLALAASLALTDYIRAVTTPGAVPASSNITLANLQASITELVNLTRIMVPSMQVRTTATFSKTSDTALANVPGLTVNLVAGRNYRITARLHCTCAAAGGARAGINGTCTAGSVILDGACYSAAAIAQARATALGLVAGIASGTTPFIEIRGLISVSVGGTLTVQFSQSASNATPSVVLIGSSLFVDEVP